ncbi:MAG: hypothetical protein ABI707_17310 [Ferruginibacter sp.]
MNLEPVTIDGRNDLPGYGYAQCPSITDGNFPERWVNIYWVYGYARVSYFCLGSILFFAIIAFWGYKNTKYKMSA